MIFIYALTTKSLHLNKTFRLMKKTIFLSIFLFIFSASISFAQKGKCTTTTDPFSSETVKSYELLWYGLRHMYFESKGEHIKVELRIGYSGAINVTVPKGTEFLFKMENNDIVKLLTAEDALPSTSVSGTSSMTITSTKYIYVFSPSKDDITKLAGSSLVILRYPNPQGGTIDLENKGARKKWMKGITDGAKCMLNN